MVLIDTPRNKDKGCHMVASSVSELHEFAKSVGIKKCWFENKLGF
jgi:hypothetical protein